MIRFYAGKLINPLEIRNIKAYIFKQILLTMPKFGGFCAAK